MSKFGYADRLLAFLSDWVVWSFIFIVASVFLYGLYTILSREFRSKKGRRP